MREGRLLLVRRASHRRLYPGDWSVPGGHLDPGETPTEALLRELREEIGIEVTRAQALSDLPGAAGAVFHLFTVTGWEGTPRLRGDEHTALCWCRLEAAPARAPLAPAGMPDVVARLAAGPGWPEARRAE